MKKIVMMCGLCIMLSGCSWSNRRNVPNPTNNSTNSGGLNNGNSNQGNANQGNMNQGTNNQRTNDVQALMDEFKARGVKIENEQKLNSFDFAAHEGRSMMLNGETVYVYRLNMNDTKMQEWAKSVRDKNMITVNQNGKNQEYSAIINQDVLLVYPKNANVTPMDEIFRNYAWK